MPYAHLERCSACSVFCSRDHPATDTGFRHQGPSRNRSQAVIRLIFGSASARPPCPQVLQCQPRVAKGASGRSSPRPPYPQVLQWHPHVPNNPTISLKPASKRTSTGLRHGAPTHRYLSANPAWRRGLLTGLRHGALAHRYFSGIPTWRRWSSDRSSARGPCPQVLQCQSRVARGSSGHSSARRPLPQVSQCHPGVAKGSAVGSTAALRHGHLARKPLSGIPAWRRWSSISARP